MAKQIVNEIRLSPSGPVMDTQYGLPHSQNSEICRTCSGWKPLPADQTIGQCIPSMKSQPSSLITLDRQSCGKWDAEKWKPKPA